MRKKNVIKDILNESTALNSSKGERFKRVVESILNDQDEDAAAEDDLGGEEDDAPMGDDLEDGFDELDSAESDEPVEDDTFETDTEDSLDDAEDGSVTVEFTADEVELLRSILAKIDGGDAEVEVEDDIVEDEPVEDDMGEDEDVDVEDEDLGEEDDMPEDDMDDTEEFEEFEEETEVGKGSPSQFAKTVSDAAPKRKKETPSVNRKPVADAPDINNSLASGEGDAATGVGGPVRKKETPSYKRDGALSGTRIKPGKDMYHIGK